MQVRPVQACPLGAGHDGVGTDCADSCEECRPTCPICPICPSEGVLDVVCDHTAEGDHLGPTLSLRLDNPSYYRLSEDPRYCTDATGTGNSPLMRSPHVRLLVEDPRHVTGGRVPGPGTGPGTGRAARRQ